MEKVSHYRKHAAQCRDLAERAEADEERQLLSELANHWDAIADIRERLKSRKPPQR